MSKGDPVSPSWCQIPEKWFSGFPVHSPSYLFSVLFWTGREIESTRGPETVSSGKVEEDRRFSSGAGVPQVEGRGGVKERSSLDGEEMGEV